MTPNEVTLHIEPCIWGHVRRQWGKKDTWGGTGHCFPTTAPWFAKPGGSKAISGLPC